MYGSDAKLASEPNVFKEYCSSLDDAYIASIKKVNKDNLNPFKQMRKVFQKSLYYKVNIKKNTVLIYYYYYLVKLKTQYMYPHTK